MTAPNNPNDIPSSDSQSDSQRGSASADQSTPSSAAELPTFDSGGMAGNPDTSSSDTSSSDSVGASDAAGIAARIQVGRTGPLNAESGQGAASASSTPASSHVSNSQGQRNSGPGGDRRPRERRDRKPPRENRPVIEPMTVKAVVPPPSRRDNLSAELEAEINAALGGMSLDEMIGGSGASNVGQAVEMDGRVRATVVRVHGDNVFFSLTGRNEGVASVRQFANAPEPGAIMDVVVRSFNEEDGLYEVVVPGASIDVSDWSDITDGAVVEARITGSNVGGLECMVNNIRGFIPASQISMFRVENLGEFVNQKMLCVVTESNPMRRNLVLSHRAILEREKEAARQKILTELEVGQIREGTVRSIRDFGAFVDIGGVDGLIHISQLSWDRVKHPSEVLKEGQKVKVKVEKFDPQTSKIGLSYRDLLDRPWDNIQERFPVGTVVSGTVTRLAKFGAFVKIATGIEGLVHISEVSHQRVRHLGSLVEEGKNVEVKILSIDVENQRIALSLKATVAPPEPEPGPEEAPDEPTRTPLIAKRNAPLKGGMDRPSGGDKFGLNW